MIAALVPIVAALWLSQDPVPPEGLPEKFPVATVCDVVAHPDGFDGKAIALLGVFGGGEVVGIFQICDGQGLADRTVFMGVSCCLATPRGSKGPPFEVDEQAYSKALAALKRARERVTLRWPSFTDRAAIQAPISIAFGKIQAHRPDRAGSVTILEFGSIIPIKLNDDGSPPPVKKE